jgi:hypothetical protein
MIAHSLAGVLDALTLVAAAVLASFWVFVPVFISAVVFAAAYVGVKVVGEG